MLQLFVVTKEKKKIQISYIINLITGKLQIRLKFHVELNLIFFFAIFFRTFARHKIIYKKEKNFDESDQEARIYL